MQRVCNSVEKNVVLEPINLVVCPAITSKQVIPTVIGKTGEWAGRYIQNVGANACYYAIGHDCDATNFNGILAPSGTLDANGFGPGSQLDCSNFGHAVYIYSVTGTTIAVTVLKRNDNAQGTGGII